MLTLVPFSAMHFDVLSGWFASERDVVQWAGPAMSFPVDRAQLAAVVEDGRADPPLRLSWMAEDEGELVGHAQLALDWRNGNATLSRVAIAPAARGRRLAAPMLEQVIEQAFVSPLVERLELNVYSFNAPALHIYERLGFTVEGVRRSSARVGPERWDTVIMAQLRSEWTIRRTAGALLHNNAQAETCR